LGGSITTGIEKPLGGAAGQLSRKAAGIALLLLAGLGLSQPAQAQQLVSEKLFTGLRQSALSVYRLQITPGNKLLVQGSSQATATTPGASSCNLLWNDNFLLDQNLDTLWTQRGPALNGGWTDLIWNRCGDFTIFGDQQYVPTGASSCSGRNLFIGRYSANTRQSRWTQAYNFGPRLNRVGKLTPAADGGYLLSASSLGSTQSWQLAKTDSAGALQWVKGYSLSLSETPSLLQTSARNPNHVLMVGTGQYGYPYDEIKLRLLLVNQRGDSLRHAFINPLQAPWSIRSVSNHITALSDGSFLIPAQADSTSAATGQSQAMPILLCVDSTLNLRWYHLERTPASQRIQYGGKMAELADGSLLALLAGQNLASTSGHFTVQRLDGSTGVVTTTYAFTSTACPNVSSYDLVPMSDGHTLYVGGSCFTGAGNRGYVAVIDLQNLPNVVVPVIAGPVITGPPVVTTPLGTAPAKTETTFSLAPNPAQGTATLHWQLAAGTKAASLQFYTALGQVARRVALPAATTGTVEINGLAAGTYLVRLLDAQGAALGRAQQQVVLP
jgi:hypothetical protein